MPKRTSSAAAQVAPSRKAHELKFEPERNHPSGGSTDAATGSVVIPNTRMGLHGRHDRILRRPEVEVRTGLSRSTIYEMMAEGTFPRPLRLGKRAVGWTETAIADWLASRDLAVA